MTHLNALVEGRSPRANEEDIKNAMSFAIWSVSGPTNDAEVGMVNESVEDAYNEYIAVVQPPAPPVQGARRPTDEELLGVLNAARVALKNRDQSSFEVRVLGGLQAAIELLEGVSLPSTESGGK